MGYFILHISYFVLLGAAHKPYFAAYETNGAEYELFGTACKIFGTFMSHLVDLLHDIFVGYTVLYVDMKFQMAHIQYIIGYM